eukprot:365052-Chlamydomonas_euryale.AAC.45
MGMKTTPRRDSLRGLPQRHQEELSQRARTTARASAAPCSTSARSAAVGSQLKHVALSSGCWCKASLRMDAATVP